MSTPGRSTAVHSTSRPADMQADAKAVTSFSPMGIEKAGDRRMLSGFMSSLYCVESDVISAMLALVMPDFCNRCTTSAASDPRTSPLVLIRMARFGCCSRTRPATSSKARRRRSGSPAPAKHNSEGKPSFNALFTASATSSGLGSKPVGSGRMNLDGENPGPRDSISETALQRLVIATYKARPMV